MPGRRAPFERLRRGDEKLTDGPGERERLQMSSCVRGNKQRGRKLKRSWLSSRVVNAEGESRKTRGEGGGWGEEGGGRRDEGDLVLGSTLRVEGGSLLLSAPL